MKSVETFDPKSWPRAVPRSKYTLQGAMVLDSFRPYSCAGRNQHLTSRVPLISFWKFSYLCFYNSSYGQTINKFESLYVLGQSVLLVEMWPYRHTVCYHIIYVVMSRCISTYVNPMQSVYSFMYVEIKTRTPHSTYLDLLFDYFWNTFHFISMMKLAYSCSILIGLFLSFRIN